MPSDTEAQKPMSFDFEQKLKHVWVWGAGVRASRNRKGDLFNEKDAYYFRLF